MDTLRIAFCLFTSKQNTPFYSHFAVASFRLGQFGVTRDDSDSEQERDQYHDPESPIQQDNNEEYTPLDPEVDQATQQLIDFNIGVSQELIGPSISFAPGELTEENNLPYQQPNPPHRVPSPIRPPPVVAFPMATPSDKEYGRSSGKINDQKKKNPTASHQKM